MDLSTLKASNLIAWLSFALYGIYSSSILLQGTNK